MLAHDLHAKADRFSSLVDRAATVGTKNPFDPLLPPLRHFMDGLLDLAKSVPDGASDTELKRLLIWTRELHAAAQAQDTARALELAAYCRLALLRLMERITADSLEDPATAFVALEDMLPATLQAAEFARILGVTTRTVTTWRQDRGKSIGRLGSRVVHLAQMAACLQHSMTPTGILLWLQNPLPVLGNRTPLAALDEGSPELVQAALEAATRVRG